MAQQHVKLTPHVFVLFGATGDLSQAQAVSRPLPSGRRGPPPDEYAIIGSGRHSPGSDDEFRDKVRSRLDEFVDDLDDKVVRDLLSRLTFQTSSADDGADLAAAVSAAPDRLGHDARTLIYLSIPPTATQAMIGMLGRENLTDDARVVVEKPFGTDLASSRELEPHSRK